MIVIKLTDRIRKLNIILQVIRKPMGVPYFRDPSDQSSRSFIDLVKDPDRISEIPELKGWPELEEFVAEVNRPIGMYRTIGTEKASYMENGRHVINGYVGFGFRDLRNVADKHYHYALFDNFNDFEQQNPLPPDVYVSWDLVPTYYGEAQLDGLSFDIWVRSVADSPENAREKRAKALKLLQEFLAPKSHDSSGRIIQK